MACCTVTVKLTDTGCMEDESDEIFDHYSHLWVNDGLSFVTLQVGHLNLFERDMLLLYKFLLDALKNADTFIIPL